MSQAKPLVLREATNKNPHQTLLNTAKVSQCKTTVDAKSLTIARLAHAEKKIADWKRKTRAQASALLVNVPYLDTTGRVPETSLPLDVVLFRNGAIVSGWVKPKVQRAGGFLIPRGRIDDMSTRSRIRLCFQLSNAPHGWAVLITLTFAKQPKCPREALNKWTRAFRAKFKGDWQWAWVMEYQRRGVVHYHIFLGADLTERFGIIRTGSIDRVIRRGCETSVLRGAFDDWCVSEWMRATGDRSRRFKRFQRGGICELFRTPDAAARYAAKEASKSHQKQLPDGIDGGRRWFWTSKACKPKPTAAAKLTHWPFGSVYSHLFNKRQIEEYLTDYVDLTTDVKQAHSAQ